MSYDESPPYELFRKYSDFVPDLADFALSERQCGRLLADLGMDMHAGAGLGDIRILYNQLSKGGGFLTYQGLERLHGLLSKRKRRHDLAKIAERPLSSSQQLTSMHSLHTQTLKSEIADNTGFRAMAPHHSLSIAPAFRGGGQEAWTTNARPEKGSAQFINLLRSSSILPSQSLSMISQQMSMNWPNAIATTVGAGPNSPSPHFPSQNRHSSPPSSPRHLISPTGQSSNSMSARPSLSCMPSTANPQARLIHGASTVSTPLMSNLGAIIASRDPPLLLRETLPLPLCEFPHIRNKLKGVKELMLNHDNKLCLTALKDLYQEWEQAVEEKMIKKSLKKKSAVAAVLIPEASSSAVTEIPLDGAIFMLIMGACCSLALGKYDVAMQVLASAESRFSFEILGQEHPYYYCISFCQAMVYYYRNQFEMALHKFEAARDLSDLVARDMLDPISLKNCACCLNNIGACCQMLGRRSEAVASYKAAVERLRSTQGLNSPTAATAMRNLSNAVRTSFALDPTRPHTAPPAGRTTTLLSNKPQVVSSGSAAAAGGAGLPVSVGAAGGKLQAFLRQAVTLTIPKPVTTLPVWASRSNGEEAAKKAAAKAKGKGKESKDKGKQKVKVKASAGLQISYPMTYYNPPTYGVANVSLAVKRKPKKKAAK